MNKEKLFISYIWKDGNSYTNDDIFEFVAEIDNCENVIIVLTTEYLKSVNYMFVALNDAQFWAVRSTQTRASS